MSSEQLMILNMVSDGKLTVDEATLLLESIARLEINDSTLPEESITEIEPEPRPEPVSDPTPKTVMATEPVPDSIEEQTNSKRNVWESLKRYIQRFRQTYPS